MEIVGTDTRDASTLYSILNAGVTIPLLYTIRLDGIGFRNLGTPGLRRLSLVHHRCHRANLALLPGCWGSVQSPNRECT